MTIRELTVPEEFDACMDLQRDGFGWSDVELMPMRFFVVSRLIGGLVLGAFEGGKMVGFLSAIPGIRDGKPYWHSHILSVSSANRNSGIGTNLKFAQKEQALQRGIRLIEWTFDPMMSRNAYLNIEKLGVIVRRYYPSLYGKDRDRLVAEWWLDRPRTSPSGETRRVSIGADPEVARAERARIREEFLLNIKEDFYVAGFERHGETSNYVFVRGASCVDLPD
jgi:predicted GNAT superfamily acetyltransferase